VGQLIPPPVRTIPIPIGGTGPKRALPAVARYADIWHTFLSVEAFTEASARIDELAAATGRSGNDIERSVHRLGAPSAEAYRAAGATTFITEIPPTPPPDTTSAPWRRCWPGVTVSTDRAFHGERSAENRDTSGPSTPTCAQPPRPARRHPLADNRYRQSQAARRAARRTEYARIDMQSYQ
jgi:hypothetical protein